MPKLEREKTKRLLTVKEEGEGEGKLEIHFLLG